MKIKRGLAVIGLALVLLFTLTACSNNAVQKDTYTLSGRVIDFEGKAIEDAKLFINDSDGTITTTTNENGEWKGVVINKADIVRMERDYERERDERLKLEPEPQEDPVSVDVDKYKPNFLKK